MRDRLASETEKERAARLRQMSVNKCHRLATETEERAARLQQMSAKIFYTTSLEVGAQMRILMKTQMTGPCMRCMSALSIWIPGLGWMTKQGTEQDGH